jgi:predicted enzyme related to lactoylglutathione lyase
MAHGDITHIEIPVTDLTQAKDFYERLFGWEISASPGFEDYPMWRAPNQISGGALTQRAEGFTQPRSYVEVDSIDETLTRVRELGGTVLLEKTEISPTSWWAVLADADGNAIGLYEGSTEV